MFAQWGKATLIGQEPQCFSALWTSEVTIRSQSQGTWALLHHYSLRSIALPWAQDSRFLQMYGVTLWVFLVTRPANSSCLSSLVRSAHLRSLRLGFAWVPPLRPRRNSPPGRKLGDSEASFVRFPSLGDHSSMLPVFQCPKAIASYILSSLWLLLWEGKSPSYSIKDGIGSSIFNFHIMIPDYQG